MRAVFEKHEWGRTLLERMHHADDLLARRETWSQAGGFLSSTLGVVAGFLTFLFIGLFVAFDPRLYRQWLLQLVPPERRARAEEVVDAVGNALRMWMAGKLLAMFVVGVSTWGGLALIDVPLGLTLALIAALLTFIPNFGPVLSAFPAVLLALIDSPTKALYVVALYVGVQTVESYLLTPLVQKRTVSLPPALGLVGQVVLGAVGGTLGLLVATPLTVAGLVLVRELYVRDVLNSRTGSSERHGDALP
jgi:predicted PurR-regulated permease PerM